jgi:hypothetical protein
MTEAHRPACVCCFASEGACQRKRSCSKARVRALTNLASTPTAGVLLQMQAQQGAQVPPKPNPEP